ILESLWEKRSSARRIKEVSQTPSEALVVLSKILSPDRVSATRARTRKDLGTDISFSIGDLVERTPFADGEYAFDLYTPPPSAPGNCIMALADVNVELEASDVVMISCNTPEQGDHWELMYLHTGHKTGRSRFFGHMLEQIADPTLDEQFSYYNQCRIPCRVDEQFVVTLVNDAWFSIDELPRVRVGNHTKHGFRISNDLIEDMDEKYQDWINRARQEVEEYSSQLESQRSEGVSIRKGEVLLAPGETRDVPHDITATADGPRKRKPTERLRLHVEEELKKKRKKRTEPKQSGLNPSNYQKNRMGGKKIPPPDCGGPSGF
ncbi:hypothetical protein HK097_001438, partial [Rhizophlyctis rosea]